MFNSGTDRPFHITLGEVLLLVKTTSEARLLAELIVRTKLPLDYDVYHDINDAWNEMCETIGFKDERVTEKLAPIVALGT